MTINNFIDAQARQQRAILTILRQRNGVLELSHLCILYNLASLETLCRICHEMPQLHYSVSEYVSTHFRGKKLFVDETCCRRSDQFFRCFKNTIYLNNAIQQVHVFGMDETTLNCVSSNFLRLTKITFEGIDPNVPCERADILADLLGTAQFVEFNQNQTRIDAPIIDRILDHARNIRVLIINSSQTTSMSNAEHDNDGTRLYSLLFPRLVTLQLDDGIVSSPLGFLRLLRHNSNIQHLIFTRNIRLVLDFLKEYKIRLLRLDVTIRADDIPYIASIVERSNWLFNNGHFQHLFITCNKSTIFKYRLNGLKGIVFDGAYVRAIGQCTQLTHLKIDSIGRNGSKVAHQLTALSVLYITRATLQQITPLICQAPELIRIIIKTIDIKSLNEHDVRNLQNLAEQRSRLPNARRLKIYLEETPYCVFKRYTAGYAQWLKFCRIEELLDQN